jgi:hypothetical protein
VDEKRSQRLSEPRELGSRTGKGGGNRGGNKKRGQSGDIREGQWILSAKLAFRGGMSKATGDAREMELSED